MNKGHGRLEKRGIQTSALLNDYMDWHRAGVYRPERTLTWLRQGQRFKTSPQIEYGVTSLPREKASPQRLIQICRKYWLIETG